MSQVQDGITSPGRRRRLCRPWSAAQIYDQRLRQRSASGGRSICRAISFSGVAMALCPRGVTADGSASRQGRRSQVLDGRRTPYDSGITPRSSPKRTVRHSCSISITGRCQQTVDQGVDGFTHRRRDSCGCGPGSCRHLQPVCLLFAGLLMRDADFRYPAARHASPRARTALLPSSVQRRRWQADYHSAVYERASIWPASPGFHPA